MSEKLSSQMTIRITDELFETLQLIAKRERRTSNEVARALLERGVEKYKEDLQLFEPLEDDPFLIQVKQVQVGRKKGRGEDERRRA